jgi:IclR family transcriptional regulator, KDG regulon repressor
MVTRVSAVERGIQILRAFEARDEYSLTELVSLLSLNKSTAYGILQTLTDHRFLTRDPQTRRYRLGPALIRLGHLAHEQTDVRRISRPYMEALVQEIRKSVLLGTFHEDRLTIIDKVDPIGTLHVSAAIGQQIPFSAGSFGRVFLAWLPESRVDHLIETYGLEVFTPASITDPAAYKEELALVRSRGYAVDDTEEYLLGVRAVSVPLMGPEGVVAGLTVVGFTSRGDDQPGEQAIKAALAAAQQISTQLGADLAKPDEPMSANGGSPRQPPGLHDDK